MQGLGVALRTELLTYQQSPSRKQMANPFYKNGTSCENVSLSHHDNTNHPRLCFMLKVFPVISRALIDLWVSKGVEKVTEKVDLESNHFYFKLI